MSSYSGNPAQAEKSVHKDKKSIGYESDIKTEVSLHSRLM